MSKEKEIDLFDGGKVKIYIRKGVQVIKLKPKNHPNITKLLTDEWYEIWAKYKIVWDKHHEAINSETDEMRRTIRKAITRVRTEDLPTYEFSEADWKGIISDIGKFKGDSIRICYGGMNSPLVIIKKEKL